MGNRTSRARAWFRQAATAATDRRRHYFHHRRHHHRRRRRRAPRAPHAFDNIRRSLLDWGDPYYLLADYRPYLAAHARIDRAYRDPSRWAAMAILNTLRVGKFSSDRTIQEYARDIWSLKPLPVPT